MQMDGDTVGGGSRGSVGASGALSAYMRLWRSPAPLIHKLNMTLLRATASVAIVLAAAALGIGAGAVILFVMG